MQETRWSLDTIMLKYRHSNDDYYVTVIVRYMKSSRVLTYSRKRTTLPNSHCLTYRRVAVQSDHHLQLFVPVSRLGLGLIYTAMHHYQFHVCKSSRCMFIITRQILQPILFCAHSSHSYLGLNLRHT